VEHHLKATVWHYSPLHMFQLCCPSSPPNLC